MTASSTPMAGSDVGHTPGPWEFLIDGDWPMIYSSAIDPEEGHRIPVVDLFHGGYNFADYGWPLEANAHLIAAAPELLEALERVLADEEVALSRPDYEFARAAMRKATANPIDTLPSGEGHE